jgi:hypothetical protein
MERAEAVDRRSCSRKARFTMPMHNERRRHQRTRGRGSALDWFGEDPWGDPELAAFQDDEDEDYTDLWESSEEERAATAHDDDETEDWRDESFDDWGPIRARHRRGRSD